ncbi:4'-phosphopantetheinyl transferase superfamily protein [Blastococcus sp. TF02A-30]|uniref:4'-phosphopantetheinyl transferase family protein n=1 Tax=Blastococcus sp. TF02A-30 TaxID=2250580 RepID=UPI000DEA36E3|nr:4'-phosphopantetheinyl transferase superfamily protein [Blastococcus sp. TF02A-30]RBY89592.1 4-phosphopantetheinyl transferase [Blastococcus sp. TF02A-30]
MPAACARRPAAAVAPRPSAPVVRLVPLERDPVALAADRRLLHADERAHADRATAAVARRRIALRAALRRLTGSFLALPPAAVPLHAGEHGRPELDVEGADVACSRSGEHGLVAVAVGCRMGVDVEQIAPWSHDALDEGWLSPAERAALLDLAPPARALAATRCWTRKEAVLKGTGSGLTDHLAALEVGVVPGPVVVGDWLVEDVPAPRGFVASIATSPSHPVEEPPRGRADR